VRVLSSHRRSARAIAACGGLLLAAATLTACGGDDANDTAAPSGGSSSSASASASAPAAENLTPTQRVVAASESFSEEGSARFTIDVDISAAGQEQSTSGEGVMDIASNAVQLKMTVPGQNAEIEVITIDGALYMRGMPGQPADEWVKTDVASAGGGIDPSTTDPTQTLGMLRAVSDDVQEGGTETIRDVEATKYTGTIDMKKALDAAEGQSAEQVKQAQQAMEALGVTTIPFELYLDEKNRPVRMVQTLNAELGEQKLSTATTMDFFDWGSDVSVEAPDPADVVEGGAGAKPSAAPTAAVS
jgi:hypothetical protein